MTLVEVSIVVVMVGILGSLATVGFTRYRRSARMAEAKNLVTGIRSEQEAFKTESGVYWTASISDTSFYPAASPGAFATQWGGPCGTCLTADAWTKLNVHPDKPVMYGYATIAGVGTELTAHTPGVSSSSSSSGGIGGPGVYGASSGGGDDDDPSSSCKTIKPTDPYYLVKAKGDTDGDGVSSTVLALSCLECPRDHERGRVAAGVWRDSTKHDPADAPDRGANWPLPAGRAARRRWFCAGMAGGRRVRRDGDPRRRAEAVLHRAGRADAVRAGRGGGALAEPRRAPQRRPLLPDLRGQAGGHLCARDGARARRVARRAHREEWAAHHRRGARRRLRHRVRARFGPRGGARPPRREAGQRHRRGRRLQAHRLRDRHAPEDAGDVVAVITPGAAFVRVGFAGGVLERAASRVPERRRYGSVSGPHRRPCRAAARPR